jgi:hypothetical protein
MAKKATTEGQESKRFESRYNPTILKELINEGLNATQIMERMSIKHKQVLKQYILRLCSDEKTYFEVHGLYVKSTTRPRVNSKGHLVINLENFLPEHIEVFPGDEFSIIYDDEKLILTKV